MPSVKKNVTKTVDLRPAIARLGLGARPQKKRPTCSVFATVNAIEYAVAAKLKKGVQLSQEFLNWAKNAEAKKKQDGDFFHIIWDGYKTRGICEEGLLPYQEAYDPDLKVSEECTANARKYQGLNLGLNFMKEWDAERGLTPSEFKSVLKKIDQGWPVMCGMRWQKEAKFQDDIMLWVPAENVFDGHSILFVGYVQDASIEDGGYFLVSDSGSNRNDFKISFRFVKDYANDACWVE